MALPAPAQPQPQPPRHQAKGSSPPGGAEGRAMTAPMTRADLEVAVSKLATKEELAGAVSKLATKKELADAVDKLATKADLALLQKDVDSLKEKMADLQEEMRAAHKNFATKQDLEAAISGAMLAMTWRMLGGMAVLLALFRYLG